MRLFTPASLLLALMSSVSAPAHADEKEAMATIDRAIKAMGGEEKLVKVEAITWSGQVRMTYNENTSDLKNRVTAKGLDHFRSELEGEINGNPFKGVSILRGAKGWRKFGDDPQELEGEILAGEKQRAYLTIIPTTLVPLKGKGFKVESAADEEVGDKPAAKVKATGPDGKAFTLLFDKETGLPVKLTATVMSFQGGEVEQETRFGDYKDFGGIKKATRIESRREGRKFMEMEIEEFKVLEKVRPGLFEEPK